MERAASPRFPVERVEILLVEDDPRDVRLTREALRDEKVTNTLHVVADDLEALAFLRREGANAGVPRPHLVLLDLDLPWKKGREVLRQMKGDPALRKIPVVIVTGSRANADASRALQLGAAGFVVKPLEFRQLARIIQDSTDLWISIVTVRPEMPAMASVPIP